MNAAASSILISDVDPLTDPRWLALLRLPAASLFHSPPWLQAVADAYGFQIRACLATDSAGDLVGGVAYCELNDAAGHRLVAAPFCDTCDPLFTSCEVWREFFSHLQSHGLVVNLRCLSEPRVYENGDLAIAKKARWHRVSLEGSERDLWTRIAPECRRAIRRAQNMNVKVNPISGEQDRNAFHRLHASLRKRKYRLLAQPPEFFESIETRFRAIDGWHSLGAFLEDRMIAGNVYLKWGDVLYYKFNASCPEDLGVRPNNLLAWSGMMLGRSLGCRFLDLGPSDDDQPGLIRFKRNLGATEQELQFLRWTPPGWQERPSARSILGDVTRLFTEPGVPDEVTARAGAALYRYFA